MEAQLVLAGVTASWQTSDMRITHDTTGAGNDITLAAGTTGTDLFASLSGFSSFDSAIPGANATSGYQETGMSVIGGDPSGLAINSRYYFKVNVV